MAKSRGAKHRGTRLRFERWAANPSCQSNVSAVVHNVSMREVAIRESPGVHIKVQSRLMFQRGVLFENAVLSNSGERLIRELRRQQIVGPDEVVHFSDLTSNFSEEDVSRLDAAVAATEAWLERLDDLPRGRHLVRGIVLRIPRGVLLPEATLKLDVAFIDTTMQPFIIKVGEIKSYADRGGFTQAASLASARAQAGVYVHAFQLVIEKLNLTSLCKISERGFLVLASPGSNFPSLRWDEDLRWQSERAKRGFELLEKSAADLNGEFAFNEDHPQDDLVTMVLDAPTDFKDACISFCERAPTCLSHSLLRDDGAFLGDNVVRFLNGVKLSRVEAIIGGAIPMTDAELDLKRRLDGETEEDIGFREQ